MRVMVCSEKLPTLVLLAGGLATRLRPITATIPKSMVEAAGEPFIAHQLRLAVDEGVRDVVLCVGHLGEQIESFVGDGARFGCKVRYSYDGPDLLGTGGALASALPLLDKNFMVMYGDSYLDVRLSPIYEAFQQSGKPALMVVFRNEGLWDSSNVEFSDGKIHRYSKINRTPKMHYIDYGFGVLKSDLIREWALKGRFDLANLYGSLVDEYCLAGYEVHNRFYEIGSPDGLRETDAYLRNRISK